MNHLYEQILYSTDVTLINSPEFYGCCIHMICIEGTIKFRYNEKLFTMCKNDIAIISYPQFITELVASDANVEYIAAPLKYLITLLPANNYSIRGGVSLFDNPIINVNDHEAEEFRRDIDNIRNRLTDNNHHFYKEMVGGLFQTMIYDLFEFHSKYNKIINTTDRNSFIVQQFLTMVEAGFPGTHREISFYAMQLSVTPKYLGEIIKRITGKSISSLISQSAITIAIGYLKDNTLSISQIADIMQFKSISYFSRYCKKHLGVSPSEFRTLK